MIVKQVNGPRMCFFVIVSYTNKFEDKLIKLVFIVCITYCTVFKSIDILVNT